MLRIERHSTSHTHTAFHIHSLAGATALHWACLKEDARLIHTLVEAGANVDARDNERQLPLVRIVHPHLPKNHRLASISEVVADNRTSCAPKSSKSGMSRPSLFVIPPHAQHYACRGGSVMVAKKLFEESTSHQMLSSADLYGE